MDEGGGLVETEHPDAFLVRLCHESPGRFLEALERVRARLRNPPVSRETALGRYAGPPTQLHSCAGSPIHAQFEGSITPLQRSSWLSHRHLVKLRV